jgi:hypothetical protein
MPNKIYRAVEAPVVFRDSGGDRVLALQNLAGGASTDGQISAQYDRGAGSKAQLHEIIGVFQFATAPQIGEVVEIWLFQSDGTYVDGTVGTTAGTLPAAKFRNGMLVGAVVVDTISVDTDIVARFIDVPISSRYYSIGVFNRVVSDNLRNTANTSRVIVTPMPPELQ